MKALAASIIAITLGSVFLMPIPAQAWDLTAVVKSKDGTPSIIGYGFGNDRQACIAAMDAIKKMQSNAVIVRPCVSECLDKTC